MISILNSIVSIFICSTVALISGITWASAQETVGGADAVLLRPKAPHASVILMPGSDGAIGAAPGGVITHLQGNQLVRTRTAYLALGLAMLVMGSDKNLSIAVQHMAAIKRPVTVVATSRETLRAA